MPLSVMTLVKFQTNNSNHTIYWNFFSAIANCLIMTNNCIQQNQLIEELSFFNSKFALFADFIYEKGF